jgi:Zn-dependent protease
VDLTRFLLVAPVLLFSLVAHEYAHGYAALRQGDTTAYQLGRLTWNPVKHIDPFMTVLVPTMLFFAGGPIFGGAKPVPVEPRNFRRYKRGDIIVSLAGVATNFALAPLCAVAVVVLGVVGHQLPALAPSLAILQTMLSYGVLVNLTLALFNLLPLPPLDGSRVFKYLLPPAWAIQYQNLGRFGFLLLFLLLSFGGGLVARWMAPVQFLYGVAMRVAAPYLLPSPLG